MDIRFSVDADIVFNAEDACSQTFGFLARRGAGKTYAAGVLVEGLLSANEQVVVLDPVGVWYGLRIARPGADGARAFQIPVFGGDHGDVALTPTSGSIVADLVVRTGTSVVLDVSSFRMGERKRFVTEFAEEFFEAKKRARSPVHVVFEEAQVFAAQKPQKGEERMLGAVEAIVRLGRNYGIGASLISQRPESVNKEVLNQVECLVALQTNGAQERKAIAAWVAQNTDSDIDVVGELPGLDIGEAVVWSPQWLKKFTRTWIADKRSADVSATPKRGAARAAPAHLTAAALDALKEQMGAVEAEAAAADPTRLRARVAQLERELTVARSASADPAVVAQAAALDAWTKTLVEGVRAAQNIIADSLATLGPALKATLDAMASAGGELVRVEASRPPIPAVLASAPRGAFASTKGVAPIALGRNPPAHKAISRASTMRADAPKLKKGARAMLEALASMHPRALTREEIGMLAGLSSGSGTFSDYLSAIRRGGFVEESRSGAMSLTPVGLEVAGDVEAVKTPDEVLALWMPRFKAGARRMLQALVDNPDGLSRAELGAAAGISPESGTFSDYLSSLRRSKMLDERNGDLRPSPLISGSAK